MSAEHEIRAAGGVLWRETEGGTVEIALVHRPRYDDWSFPKGKLDLGESFVDGARREVTEETGLAFEIGAELAAVEYADHKGRSKVVRYWAMRVTGGDFVPNDEVDLLEWLDPESATARLSYLHDADLLELFLSGL